jgi:hypothetical protein
MIPVKRVFIHKVGDEEAEETEINSVTVMVPIAEISPHPPVKGML